MNHPKLCISLALLSVLAFTSGRPAGYAQGAPAKPPGRPNPPGGAILYTSSVAFHVSTPPGWVLDDQAGRSQGALAVLYRQGESWSNGKAVMYVNVTDKPRGNASFQRIVQDDVAETRKGNAHTIIAFAPTASVVGSRAVAYDFTNAWRSGARERAVYLDTPKAVVTVVLTAQTRMDFDRAASDFNRLLHSYGLITSDVRFGSGEQHNHAKD